MMRWTPFFIWSVYYRISEPTFTCSKSQMEIPEQCVKYVQSQQQRHQTDVNDTKEVVLESLLLHLNRFHILFWCVHCWLWTSKYHVGKRKAAGQIKSHAVEYFTHSWLNLACLLSFWGLFKAFYLKSIFNFSCPLF